MPSFNATAKTVAFYFFHRPFTCCFLWALIYNVSMRTVYVDDLFVLNLIIDYFILLATAKLCGLPLKRLRFGVSAALGGLYSVLILLQPLRFLATPVMKLLLGLLMTLIAFGNVRRLFRVYLAFLAVSAAFGGAVIAASMLAGQGLEDGLYINVSMRILTLSFATSYVVLTFVFKRLGKKAQRKTAQVQVSLQGKEAFFCALFDTGNEVYDPITGLPVMVADGYALSPLFPGMDITCKDSTSLFESIPAELRSAARFRLVPYSAIGLGLSLMPVFRPDEISVNGKIRRDLLVGISPNTISCDGEYSAII